MSRLVELAHLIEWTHAKEIARVRNEGRRGRSHKVTAAEVFDPHAATELAGLLERALAPGAASAP